MPDIFDKCSTDGGYFGRLRVAKDRFFTLPVIDDIPGPHMKFQDHDNIMWSINNYIGLANDPDIKAAAIEATETWSVSSPMGSRMMSGSTSEHIALEKSLAGHAQKENSFLFNYGYLGVLGTITALTGPDDTLIVDKLAHACIVDAALCSKSQNSGRTSVRFSRHNDMEDLESVLKSVNRTRKGGLMILAEGVYGMTGDLANLGDISNLARRYDARIFIDDAHGIGVLGEKGRGTANHLGVQKEIDIYFGTFAKAFASIGGYSATSNSVRDYIAYNARSQVFAKALPMTYVLSLKVALRKVIEGDDRRRVMWQRSEALKNGLRELGYHIGTGDSPICSVFVPVGEYLESIGMEMLTYLRVNGVFCTGLVWPVIPPGLIMFRMIPTSVHTSEDVGKTVEVFKNMRDSLKIQPLGSVELSKIAKIYRN